MTPTHDPTPHEDDRERRARRAAEFILDFPKGKSHEGKLTIPDDVARDLNERADKLKASLGPLGLKPTTDAAREFVYGKRPEDMVEPGHLDQRTADIGGPVYEPILDDRTTTRDQYDAGRMISRLAGGLGHGPSRFQRAQDIRLRWRGAIGFMPPGTTATRRACIIEKALYIARTTSASNIDALEALVGEEVEAWSSGKMEPTLASWAEVDRDHGLRDYIPSRHAMPCCYSPRHAEGLHRPGCPSLNDPPDPQRPQLP